VDLRIERDRQKLNQALTQAANERLFPTKPKPLNEKQVQARLASRPKVKLSDRRAKAEAQYLETRRPKEN
jgi:hypothetical protein